MLALELLKTDGSAKPSGATAHYADIDVVCSTVDIVRVEQLASEN